LWITIETPTLTVRRVTGSDPVPATVGVGNLYVFENPLAQILCRATTSRFGITVCHGMNIGTYIERGSLSFYKGESIL
jgi:hypothetical protein